MTRIVVLRPEPGNADTCAKLRGLGLEPLAMPVFTVVPVAWTPPDVGTFDAVLLTSANAIRHGALPDTLKTLPVFSTPSSTVRSPTMILITLGVAASILRLLLVS